MIKISNKEHWLIEQERISKKLTAVNLGIHKFSYSNILDLSLKASKYLSQNGIKKSDHVAITSKNNLDFIILINALWFIGAIPIPINSRLNKIEIDKLIEKSLSEYVINIGNDCKIENINVIDFDLLKIESCNNNFDDVEYNPESVALMLFTSGSTGDVKCVQLTFNNLFASVTSADSYINHTNNDVWLASLPFYHIGGFSIITRTIISGCALSIINYIRNENIVSELQKVKPSLISLVPTMLIQLLASDIKPWGNLRTIFLGGGPSTKNLINNAIDSNWPISTVYGSTETASMVTVASTENLKEKGLSAGKPFKNVEIAIDEKNDESNSGQILIKSKSIGNYLDINETDNIIINGEKYLSHDLGKIDENGNLQILARIDETIISGGENISLTEIYNLLSDNKEIKDTVVLGVKDEKWGQSYIIVSETKEEIVSKVISENLSKFKHPKKIYHLKKIPRNELGKIQKNKIKEIINADYL